MGANRGQSIVNPELRHWEVPNLFVVDGSVLPASLGVNPSMSIYALSHRARAAFRLLSSSKKAKPPHRKRTRQNSSMRGPGADR